MPGTFSTADFLGLRWQEYEGNPLIEPPGFSPVVADPTFLFPHESPDGRYHLFAHALRGIYHYTSQDGAGWENQGRVCGNAMRPFVRKFGEAYYLFYESIRPFAMYLGWAAYRWRSFIACRRSMDLKHCEKPCVALKPTLAWHSHPDYGVSIGNPCVVRVDSGFRLYYSAGLVRLEDCGFNEPQFIGVAQADQIEGPYEALPEPLLAPDAGSRWRNLASGSIKVLATDDGFVAMQNGIYIDPETKHSGSAILRLHSDDGLTWRYADEEPVLKPGPGWTRSHVYAFDVRPELDRSRWRLYFNARDDWHWSKGRERIGLLLGR